ncbi:2'-5' RNA ligase [Polaromonas sp. OV174]|uniref:RNA 2',3'-cyclic phosphodiesterase n=1 Tax=Polaromonas sp. OV174 TaxID=1855300 RepID=UPI0008F0C291|nr:RNA 2',3'-cyclic phosphodiesterase [Polaromonas sp. OV174]SFB94649.1 2'-5' RNA ligase [Polaromonas sp. OV174]
MTRLFFALWPDTPLREQLADYSASCVWPREAKPVAAADFHLTLRFVGNLDLAQVEPLQGLRAPDFVAFPLLFGQPELWGEVAVLRPSMASAALLELQAALDAQLSALGLSAHNRSFQPHVTLARRASDALLPPPSAIAWQVKAFYLAASLPSATGRYRILQTYGARE